MDNDDLERRRETGRRVFQEVTGMDPPVGSVAWDQVVFPHVFGDVWTRPGLTRKERRWIALTCAAASGFVSPIEAHVRAALVSRDITSDELTEWVIQMGEYIGWPTAVVADAVVRRVSKELAV